MKYSRGFFHWPSSLQWICSIVNLRLTFVWTVTLILVVPHSAPFLVALSREEAEPEKERNKDFND